MKIALISDIHANLEALEAVLRDIESQQADSVCCLGDVIGYGSDPSACLRLVRRSCEVVLMGNHEYATLGLLGSNSLNDYARESLEWTQTTLNEAEMEALSNLDLEAVRADSLLVHASPYQPDQWHYVLTLAEAGVAFQHLEQRVCFNGHSHIPMIFSQGEDGTVHGKMGHDFDPLDENRYIINVGSVGQPRDNDPRACYVLFDPDAMSVAYRRVDYDIKATQSKMIRARLPQVLIERLEVGR